MPSRRQRTRKKTASKAKAARSSKSATGRISLARAILLLTVFYFVFDNNSRSSTGLWDVVSGGIYYKLKVNNSLVVPKTGTTTRMVHNSDDTSTPVEATQAQTYKDITATAKTETMGKGNDMVVMVRTYAGDRWRADRLILPTTRMFVNALNIDTMVVLDDESELDRVWGQCLHDANPDLQIKYESQPNNWEEMFHGTAFERLGNKMYNKPGYDRQQWSTFYLDRLAEPDHEIISVIDADGCFFSYMTRESVQSDDGRIKLRAGIQNSHYQMDSKALNMSTPYEFMYPDRMPISFWKSTFVKVRDHIAREWGTSFDKAFTEFSRGRYSQFNIMATYAIAMEPDKYVLIPHDDAKANGGTVSIGSNKCRPSDVAIGCCATFGTDGCQEDPAKIAIAVNRYNSYTVGWEANQTLADLHYANVKRDLMILEQEDSSRYASMAKMCLDYRQAGRRGISNAPQCTENNDTELLSYRSPTPM